jgi:hypothetical protein
LELTKQIGVLRNRKTLDGRKADRNKVNLEYWNFNENLGDLLAPVVTQWMLHRLGLDLYREAAKPCHLMTIGSVLGLGVFDAVIWGSGVNSFAHVGRVTTQKGYRYESGSQCTGDHFLYQHEVHLQGWRDQYVPKLRGSEEQCGKE